MRVSREEMDASHRRIVEGASRLFRERGIGGVSVAETMTQAGLTHGGFYRHFGTKDDLVLEALSAAFDEFATPLEQRAAAGVARAGMAEYRELYLSAAHVTHADRGCPMPALAAELARGPAAFRAAFSAGVRRIRSALMPALRGTPEQREAAALRELAQLVGAVVLARAAEPELAERILQACREEARPAGAGLNPP